MVTDLGLVEFVCLGWRGRELVCFKVSVRIRKLWYSRTGFPSESRSSSNQTTRIRAVARMKQHVNMHMGLGGFMAFCQRVAVG